MSLELIDGYAVLLVDYGSGTLKIEQKHIRISDGQPHRIEIIWSKTVCTFYMISYNFHVIK